MIGSVVSDSHRKSDVSFGMRFLCLAVFCCLLFICCLFAGSVSIPPSDVWGVFFGEAEEVTSFIILQGRLPMAVTAVLAGAGLAAAGLLLQTAFRNPLAGPSILGVTSGASLGVAVVMLCLGGTVGTTAFSFGGYAAVVAGAFVGSLAVMAVLLGLSTVLKNGLMLLITGIMIGYLVSSAITLLNVSASSDGVRGYVLWGMGTFSGVTMAQLPVFVSITAFGILLSLLLIKPLDLLLLGESYARNLGVNLLLVRNILLLATGIVTAAVTAFCGPVSFIGLAVPHMARLLFPTDRHRIILPATMLTGAAVALACALVCASAGAGGLPLNAVTPLFGAPVVIWVLLRRR